MKLFEFLLVGEEVRLAGGEKLLTAGSGFLGFR